MPDKKIELPEHIELDSFISSQAHDLRTPFNHITGFSKMLLNTVGFAPLTDFQKEDLGTVYRSGMHALTLMNGLIDIARINRGDKETSPKDLDIEQLVAQSLAQWKKYNPGMEVQIDYQVQTTEKNIHTDEMINRQIISGFISFVALYCHGRATINITVTEEAESFIFTFNSTGVKAQNPPELDRDLFGCINRTLVELQNGEILQAVETDDGAIVRFALPKK